MFHSRTIAWLIALAVLSLPATAAPLQLPLSAIGKINQAGLWQRSSCTGVLIAPDKVLTAAHCLRQAKTGATYPLDTFHFLPGFDNGKYLAHGRVGAITFAKPAGMTQKTEAGLLTDVAIITLTEPVDLPPVVLAADDSLPAEIVHAGYMAKHPDELTVTKPCEAYHLPAGFWISDCHAEHGSSGGPVFGLTPDGPRLVGIVAAIDDKGLSFVLPLKLYRGLIETAFHQFGVTSTPMTAQADAVPTD